MKNKIFIYLLLTSLIMMASCEKEKDIQVDEKDPVIETKNLMPSSFSGIVKDLNGQGLSDVKVEISVDGVLLGRSLTENGVFEFADQKVHSTNTLLKVYSDEYSPNYACPIFKEGVFQHFEFTVKEYRKITTHSFGEELTHEEEGDYNIRIASSDYIQPKDNAVHHLKIYSQYYDNRNEIKQLMNSIKALDNVGQDIEISHSELIYVAGRDQDEILLMKKDKVFEVNFRSSIANLDEIQLWKLDQKQSRWVLGPIAKKTGSGRYFSFKASDFTYYSVLGCQNDTKKPVPYCISIINFTPTPSLNKIWAADIDFGSFDDCSQNLKLEIKKLIDDCKNGSDQYGPSIDICDAEKGTTIKVHMKVTDEAGNWDYCVSEIIIGGGNCVGDQVKPVPICLNGLNFDPKPNQNRLWFTDIDEGSYDNCSKNLTIEIKKLTDICGNGSDQFATSFLVCEAEKGTKINVRMKVTDENGNSDYCDSYVNVLGNSCQDDKIKPTPYCLNEITFVLNPGVTKIWATDINVGSYDNCSKKLKFEVKKVTDTCNNGSDKYGASINICEAERGSKISVEMKVIDEAGNWDYCQTYISVE